MATSNEAFNDMWEKYNAEKKELGGQSRSVSDHNEYASTRKASAVTIHTLKMMGDINSSFLPQLKKQAQLVQFIELFSSDSPVKAPMVGAGYAASMALSSDYSMAPVKGGGAGEGGYSSERPLLITVFQSWPQVKGLLWEFIVQRYQVADFPFISAMFVAEFERTLTTVIDRHRPFVWEELEIVMYQMLSTLILQIEEKLSMMFAQGELGTE